jgi:DNA mismatch endonuclease (patch repair protein)
VRVTDVAGPTPRDEGTRRRLQQQRREDTGPEIELRRELHRRGLRYRKHIGVLPGSRTRHDLVFVTPRVVVEVRGCYWHSCPLHGTVSTTNRDWWLDKLNQNVRRDERVARQLEEAGWTLVVVWEHEDMKTAADSIERLVRPTPP